MHVLMVADGRSPHTLGWIRGVERLGIKTTLLSSHILTEEDRGRLEAVIGPAAVNQPGGTWSRVRPRLTFVSPNRRPKRPTVSPDTGSTVHTPRLGRAVRLLTEIELRAVTRLRSRLEDLIETVRPDAVHALRIQYEGIAATGARARVPIALSTWGSDLMLWARTSERMARQTLQTLHRADVLLSDCHRDAELATSWGLRPEAPRYVVPGNFGVDVADFPDSDSGLAARLGVESRPLVVYPRGVLGFVNYQGFIDAARLLVAERVDASFVGVGLLSLFGRQVNIPGRLVCTDRMNAGAMLSLAASSVVTVSPGFSDGIPNSVLEGMAGGAIPVCGELASVRELERQGAVIAWCQPGDTASIASAIRCALRLARVPENRARNRGVVADHYSTSVSAERAREAYDQLMKAR